MGLPGPIRFRYTDSQIRMAGGRATIGAADALLGHVGGDWGGVGENRDTKTIWPHLF